MNEAVARMAGNVVYQRIGVPVEARLNSVPERSLEVIPFGVEPLAGFSVRYRPGWRSAEAELVPGEFSAPLIAQMGRVGPEGRSAFAAFAESLTGRKTQLHFRVNGVNTPPSECSQWPEEWTSIELRARSAFQEIRTEDLAQALSLISGLVVPIFGMAVALVGVEDHDEDVYGATEGNPIQTISTHYERKKVNREACIQLKGVRCRACQFNFEEFYGPRGAGYVEIHHTTPVSQLGPDYRLNITRDLEPLCANCHAMVHRTSPPLRIEELTEQILAQRRR